MLGNLHRTTTTRIPRHPNSCRDENVKLYNAKIYFMSLLKTYCNQVWSIFFLNKAAYRESFFSMYTH